MKKFAYTESQTEIILSVLALLEDTGIVDLDLDQVEVIDSAPLCEHVNDFCEKMDVLFKTYKKDGVLDGYHRDGDFFTVGRKDASYARATLDGAVHMYNMMHPGIKLIVDCYRTTSVTETYIVQYAEDCYEE